MSLFPNHDEIRQLKTVDQSIFDDFVDNYRLKISKAFGLSPSRPSGHFATSFIVDEWWALNEAAEDPAPTTWRDLPPLVFATPIAWAFLAFLSQVVR